MTDERLHIERTKDDMTTVSRRSKHSAGERATRTSPAAGAHGSSALFAALLVGAILVTVAATAQATLYKWTDERGVIHYSDQLPVDAVNRANYELSRNGLTVKKTEQARPVVQQRVPKNESEEQRMREAERERVIATRRDRALIESYTNENEIDLAKSRAVATIDGQVQSAAAFIAQMTKRREVLEGQKATFAPRPVPGAIEREIETIDEELVRQNELVAGKKKESAAVAARYESDKQRFRELHNPAGPVITSSDGRYSASQPVGMALTNSR
ncbi:MAG TPA: DUF4124 domain-containing protein [Casimicrobiaceae bacterium]|nr:DUF4124 domain-containing protein [Casimicrobiaceae bacterium]